MMVIPPDIVLSLLVAQNKIGEGSPFLKKSHITYSGHFLTKKCRFLRLVSSTTKSKKPPHEVNGTWTCAEKILNGWSITKPQRQFLLMLFTTILALRGKVNFRNLSRYSGRSARTFPRQFDPVLRLYRLESGADRRHRSSPSPAAVGLRSLCYAQSRQAYAGVGLLLAWLAWPR